MAGSVNKVFSSATSAPIPEIKSFQNGGKVANLRIATSEQWKDRMTGERKERTEWHQVVINGESLIGVVERYLKKGSKVYIEGSLRTRKWQDRDGNDKYTTEIVIAGMGGTLTMLDGARRAAAVRAAAAAATSWRRRFVGRWLGRRLEPGRRRGLRSGSVGRRLRRRFERRRTSAVRRRSG